MDVVNNLTPEMKAMQASLSIDFRIMRVVLASNNPIETMHNIRNGKYSVITLLDVIEILDAKATIEEFEQNRIRAMANQSGR